jgi:copper transport protein
MTFTEPPDPTLSIVKVVDSAGHPAAGVGAARPVPGQPQQLVVPITQPLAKGVYTVNWRSVSSTDGHVEYGAFAFGVGAVPAPGSVVRVGLQNSSPWLSAASAAGRWLLYVGLALLVGGSAIVGRVFGARLPRGGLNVLRIAVGVAAVGVAAMIEAERAVVGVRSLLPLFVTHEGMLLLALGGGVVACGVAVAAVDLWPGHLPLIAVGAAAAVTVLVHVLAGHANAPATLRPLNVFEQWVHMTAIGVWIGGLAWLLLGIRGRRHVERAAAVRAFSRIATVTLVVVLVTGVLRVITEIHPLSNLFHTSYGVTLLIKVALVGVVVLFAAFNHYRFVPALERHDADEPDEAAERDPATAGEDGGEARDRSGRRFVLDSRVEFVVAAAVLVATAVLTGLAPANTAAVSGVAGGGQQTVVNGSDYATTVRVTLLVAPGTVGSNRFTVTLADYDTGKPFTAVTSVSLGFSMPTQPSVNASTLQLGRVTGGTWQGSGLELSIVGTWRVTVLIQEPSGGVDVPLTLNVVR